MPCIKKLWLEIRGLFCKVTNFTYHIKRIKWFIQRGKRGYSDYDWWEMDTYLTSIILPMLRRLRANSCGFPVRAVTPERWDKLLDEMIECFELAEKIGGYIYETSEEMDIAYKMFQRKMRVFAKWFFCLWD